MRAFLPALVACLLLAGCTANLQPVVTSNDPVQAQAPSGADAGTAASHAVAKRVDGAVAVRLDGAQYVASRDVTVTNDFGGASHAALDLKTANGAIGASVGGKGGYSLTASLEGRGQTEQQARDALASMEVVPTDSVANSELSFSLTVKFKDTSGSPLPLPVNTANTQRGASIVAVLPAQPSFKLNLDTSNGAISVEGLHGPNLAMKTSNGALHAAGSWDASKLDTSNGAIHLDGLFNSVEAGTSNGGITGDIEASRTATQSYESSNGAIHVNFAAHDNTGFDGTAKTSNGDASVSLPDAKDSGRTDAHARTANFSSKQIQLTIKADTSNSDAEISAQ